MERTSKSRAAPIAAVKATTAADGAYRINVPQQGQCTLALPDQAGKPSAMVFSSPNPALYNFELVKAGRRLRAQAAVSMSDERHSSGDAAARPAVRRRQSHRWPWIELVKVLALPLVTLVLGYWFNASLNERQQIDNNIRLYAEMMGRREEADSNLRKDMFNSILTTFMAKDPATKLIAGGGDQTADPEPGAAGLQLPRVARHRAAVQGRRAPDPARCAKGTEHGAAAVASSRWRCR